jgi:ribosomal protein L7/L12
MGDAGWILTCCCIPFIIGLANSSQRQAARLRQLEARVTALMDDAGIDFDPDQDIRQAVVEALGNDGKIPAIKLHRKLTGSGLVEAKDYVEGLQDTTDSET